MNGILRAGRRMDGSTGCQCLSFSETHFAFMISEVRREGVWISRMVFREQRKRSGGSHDGCQIDMFYSTFATFMTI